MYLVRDLLMCMEGYELKELPPRSALEELVPAPPTAPINQLQRRPMRSIARIDRPSKASLLICSIPSRRTRTHLVALPAGRHGLSGCITVRTSPLIA